MTPALGQPVTFTHVLERHYATRTITTPARKLWKPALTRYSILRDGPIPGILVGTRTLADGEFTTVSRGEPFDYPEEAFINTHHFPAYLIAYDLRRKPVLVLPEHTTEGTQP